MLVSANIFQPLIDVFEAVLKFFHNSAGVSWGWSIVLLTVVIRAILIPLTVKQFHSMQRLQAHMPELKAIQAKYKDDKQRQQQEVMKFYSENKVNPFGSCLPLALQLPVFISLFYMLRSSLRHDICPDINPLHAKVTHACGSHGAASFLFIHDLTNTATGVTLIVLIVLYVGTQLGSSLLMSAPTMDRNQRMMLLAMPLVFVIFVIRFPAGVLVYWVTTNTWTIAQQYMIKRFLPPPPPTAAAAAAATSGGRGGGRAAPALTNGAGGEPEEAAGLSGLWRGRAKGAGGDGDASTAVASRQRDGRSAPPPPPRKKKKRSGRRR